MYVFACLGRKKIDIWTFVKLQSLSQLYVLTRNGTCQNVSKFMKTDYSQGKKSFETFINGTYNFLYFAKMQNEPFLILRRGKRKLRTIT